VPNLVIYLESYYRWSEWRSHIQVLLISTSVVTVLNIVTHLAPTLCLADTPIQINARHVCINVQEKLHGTFSFLFRSVLKHKRIAIVPSFFSPIIMLSSRHAIVFLLPRHDIGYGNDEGNSTRNLTHSEHFIIRFYDNISLQRRQQ